MPRGRSIDSLTLGEITQIVRRKQGELKKLHKARASLLRRLDSLDAEIAAIGGGNGAGASLAGGRGRLGGRRRPKNAKSLVETLADVMSSGKPMPVGDIVKAVQGAGYRSNSGSFRAIVNQTLIKERKRFASAGRGVYQLKK